jgi:hypothetical protein
MSSSLAISARTLRRILRETAPAPPLFPELDAARRDPAALKDTPAARALLAGAGERLAEPYPIAQTPYTLYREFRRSGARRGYETPYFQKRATLTAATLALFFGADDLLDVVQDYIWAICEETTWVLPAHENHLQPIDLFAAETGFQLAETAVLLEGVLHEEIAARVRDEVERRVLQPYLESHDGHWWYRGGNNWNGVCNGSAGCAFLLLEEDAGRLAWALSLVLAGLDVFFETAFEADGSSTEGVGYWQYGLMNVICFSEMLRARTRGGIDILSSVAKLARVAGYPLAVMLSPGRFASFSDGEEENSFHPGIVARLAERTGRPDVLGLLAVPGNEIGLPRRLAMALRTLLWWDGRGAGAPALSDVHLPDAGIVRLVSATPEGVPVVVVHKAGHNGENHNQNDVGNLVVHAGGETFLCDPGRGLYSRQYFSDARYENIFANSYGHSVPRIDGRLQPEGIQARGTITSYEVDGGEKRVETSFAEAYDVDGLVEARRSVQVASSGEIVLTDTFAFSGNPLPVEEALVTWREVTLAGATATLVGERYALQLTIEEPAGAAFSLEVLEEESAANDKPAPLKRLTFALPAGATVARVRARVLRGRLP